METKVSKVVRIVLSELIYIVYDVYSEIKVTVILIVREIVYAMMH